MKVDFMLFLEESAAYDAAIVVENPSAKREVNSVYDNIVDENTYKALDPAKREPSNKYQSLINPQENEVSNEADFMPFKFLVICISVLLYYAM